jgi:hypothetical protein
MWLHAHTDLLPADMHRKQYLYLPSADSTWGGLQVFVALLARHYEWTVLQPPTSYKHNPFPVPVDELQVDFKELS